MYGDKINEKYNNSYYGFPSDEVSNEIKMSKGWHLQYQKAIISSYLLGNTSISTNDRVKMDILRMYSDARQPITPYLNWLRPQIKDMREKTDEHGNKISVPEVIQKWGSTEGEWNLSTDIFSPAPKLKDIVISTFEDADFDLVADAYDQYSVDAKSTIKASMLTERYLGKKIAGFKGAMGIPHQPPDFVPGNDVEMEIHDLSGGFQLEHEDAITTALKYSFDQSDIDEVKRKVLGDFWDINQAAIEDYTDPQTGQPRIRYVDPKNLICYYNQEYDAKLAPFVSQRKYWTIYDLRKVTGWAESTLKSLAQTYCGQFGNPDLVSNMATTYDGTRITNWNGDMTVGVTPMYNGFLIPVQESQYRTWNMENKDVEMILESKWIPGTDYIFHYGIQYNMKRPEKYNTEFSIHYVKKRGMSMVERIKPFLDEIMLTWLQFQNNVCKEAPAGLAIEVQSLQNIMIGGRHINPVELLLNRTKNGHVLYKTTNSSGIGNVGGAKPVQDLPSTYGTAVEAWAKTFDSLMFNIQTEIGMSPQADASPNAANAGTGVRTAQMALDATSKSIKPIFINYIRLKNMAGNGCLTRLQSIMRYDKAVYEDMVRIIGKESAKNFVVTKENLLAKYGLKLKARATDDEKQLIMQLAESALDAGKNGSKDGISLADLLFIIDQLRSSGDIHKCMKYLLVAQKRFRQQTMADASQNQQENVQGQQALEAQKQKGQQDFVIFETNEKIRLDDKVTANKIKIDWWNNYSNWKFNKETSEQDFQEGQQQTALETILGMASNEHAASLDMAKNQHQSGLNQDEAAQQGTIDQATQAAAPTSTASAA